MTLTLTNALTAGHGRSHVRTNFSDVTTWANAANIGIGNLTAKPGARVYNSSAQTIADGAATGTSYPLYFDSERFDTNGLHETSYPANSKLVATDSGVYLIYTSVLWSAMAFSAATRLSLRVDGTTNIAIVSHYQSTAVGQTILTAYRLSAGQYVEVCGYQVNVDGAAREISSSGNYSPEFGMQYLSSG